MAKAFDVEDFKALPHEFIGTFKPANILAKGYTWWDIKGDTSAFFALFFDNLATQLSLAGMAIGSGIPLDFFYKHVMGGVGISIFLGNVYYSLQASKVAMRTGNMDTCAQPYGINTPGAIAKTFGVLVPTFAKLSATGLSPEQAAEEAWSIACAANFMGGVFEFLGAFVAPIIKRNVPTGALLVPIGGVGVTWLGINPLKDILHPHVTYNAVVGFLPLCIMWTNFFGGVNFGRVPAAGVAGLIGVILAWLTRAHDLDAAWQLVENGADIVGGHGLKWSGCLGKIGEAMEDHASLVLGLACTNFIGTYACVLSAKRKGDVYSPMESMIVDGIGSMIGALFGSPYGTTVYIGHVAYKEMGAKRGYSLLNGFLYLIFGLFGLQALIDALVPHECVLGIIVIIGFAMAGQVVEAVPPRWVPCVILGLMIAVSDMAVKGWGATNLDVSFLMNGYVWISFLYTFALMMLTDRWFLAAAGVFAVMVPLALVGLIHAAQMGLEYSSDGTISGEANAAQNGGHGGSPGWKFVVTYAVVSAFCVVMHLMQRKGWIKEAEAEDFREIQASEEPMPLKEEGEPAPAKMPSEENPNCA